MKRYRMALLMSLGAYPMALLILTIMPSAFAAVPAPLKPLFIIPPIVVWMVYVVSPFVVKTFGGWVGMHRA